ncbi:MAG: diaminopimelate epimerase [Armatimonadota bacterium]|nr:diaminopimelate epimerase [Armatimonadota bacterium]MDR7563993.1 diaminopimelate epimerase [Armatimonadota bacterium]MDR7568200.1 diaminopimelate epimerase [Armatimonadota bacterium]MDR7602101.1 diaminopimelate epimerase [Armatimonadota bacterium]
MNRFIKAHALGNDYLVVDPASLSFALTPEAIRRICDRHLGVGSDGILAHVPSDRADFGLRIYNPDGSEAEKSGNGLRIFAKYLYEHGFARSPHFTVETPGGIVACTLEVVGGRVERVTVEMGEASFWSPRIPMAGPPREVVDEPVEVEGEVVRITALTVGNPHCVVFVEDIIKVDFPRLGPALERHPAFPQRTNVQFAQVVGRGAVRIRIWERGAGETLASGSSACAVAAACVRRGFTEREVTVEMPGGALQIHVGEGFSLRMTGPATEVCRGEFSPEFVETLG